MKTIAILLFLLTFKIQLKAQFISARNSAMGNVSTCQTDVFSSLQNIAKLPDQNHFSIGLSLNNSYLIQELQKTSLVIKFPLLSGSMGLRYYQYGHQYYHENRIEIAYAKSFGEAFSIGLKFNIVFLRSGESLSKKHFLYPDIGLNYSINEKIELGIILTNVSLNQVEENIQLTSTSSILFGFSYELNNKFQLHLESILQLSLDLGVRFGFEYIIKKRLFLRSGVDSNRSFSFGMGLKFNKWKIDIASSYHNALGISPAISLGYDTLH